MKNSPEALAHLKNMFEPAIELTWNHGTERREDFSYHNGNDTDKGQLRGFGHVGFLVEDLDSACAYLEEAGVAFKKRPSDGNMRGIVCRFYPHAVMITLCRIGFCL